MKFVERLFDVEAKFAEAVQHVSIEETSNNRELRKIGKNILQLLRLTEVFRANKAADSANGGFKENVTSSEI